MLTGACPKDQGASGTSKAGDVYDEAYQNALSHNKAVMKAVSSGRDNGMGVGNLPFCLLPSTQLQVDEEDLEGDDGYVSA